MEDVGRSEAESRSISSRCVPTSILKYCRLPSSCHNLVLVSIRLTPGLPCASVLGRTAPLRVFSRLGASKFRRGTHFTMLRSARRSKLGKWMLGPQQDDESQPLLASDPAPSRTPLVRRTRLSQQTRQWLMASHTALQAGLGPLPVSFRGCVSQIIPIHFDRRQIDSATCTEPIALLLPFPFISAQLQDMGVPPARVGYYAGTIVRSPGR